MKTRYWLRLVLSSSMLAAATAGAADSSPDLATQAQQTALKQAIFTCSACHGANGRSISPTFPNLAAQPAPYLELQLHAFKSQTRADPDAQAYMWGMASQLNDTLITALAKYFSEQPGAPGEPGDATLIAQGKKIFENGIPASQVPPCASCHGAHAEGNGPFPRLAGQHAPYLLKQLLVIQSVLRTAPVMHGVIKDLSRPQMQAVATYLQSL
jgi:cytochrome c553